MDDPTPGAEAAELLGEQLADDVDPALRSAVREIEGYVAETGWDQPSRLFALVPTTDLLTREPGLAEALGVDAERAAGSLTPVEQEPVPGDRPLEDVLAEIMWPAEVLGCAAVVERLVLPPTADDELPEDPDAAQRFAAEHPERQEVRIVAAAVRGGATYCALRMRAHDEPHAVVEGVDLVPALLELLSGTLEQ